MPVIKGNPIRSFYIAAYIEPLKNRQEVLSKLQKGLFVNFDANATRFGKNPNKCRHVITDEEFLGVFRCTYGRKTTTSVFCADLSLTQTCVSYEGNYFG